MSLHQYIMNKYLFAVCTVYCLLACNGHPGLEQPDEIYISVNANVADQFSRSGSSVTANRCILEVYTEDGSLYGKRQVNSPDAEFNVKVISGRKYTLVFWADQSGANANDDGHYNTTPGLRSITVKTDHYTGNDDSFDAYYASEAIVADASTSRTIQLKRPFCRVNVAAKDENLPTELKKIKISFQNVYTTFDAMTGEVSTPGTMEYTAYVLSETDRYMSFDYLLAPTGEGSDVNFTMSFYQEDGTTTIGKPFDFTGIPLQRNYQVNVSAKLFTETSKTDIALTGIE